MTTISPLEGTSYNDLFIRDSFRDTGVYPSTGNAYRSPDIIPLQSGTLSWQTANSTYNGPDIGLAIINGGVNNIFVRTKNLNSGAGQGTVRLYYAKASLLLVPNFASNEWTAIGNAGGTSSLPFIDENGGTSIAAGEVAISNPSFLLTGLPPVTNTHYCFIAVVQTPTHPVTIPANFPSNAAFVQWVQNNPGVGWRNISSQPSTSKQMMLTVNFASINPISSYFHFRIQGRGFVTGTPINVQCTDKSCPINQNMTLPEPDVNGIQITGFDASIPGNFSGNLVVTATSPSGQFPAGAAFTVTYYQYPDLDDELEMKVAGAFRISRETEAGTLYYAPMLIQMGECTVVVTT